MPGKAARPPSALARPKHPFVGGARTGVGVRASGEGQTSAGEWWERVALRGECTGGAWGMSRHPMRPPHSPFPTDGPTHPILRMPPGRLVRVCRARGRTNLHAHSTASTLTSPYPRVCAANLRNRISSFTSATAVVPLWHVQEAEANRRGRCKLRRQSRALHRTPELRLRGGDRTCLPVRARQPARRRRVAHADRATRAMIICVRCHTFVHLLQCRLDY